jgi:hypothetical protein
MRRELHVRFCEGGGVQSPSATRLVVMCDTKAAVEEARRRVGTVLTRLGLELHPEKTRMVDLSRGREGFDFLGCHLRKRFSGPLWMRTRRRVYYLQRWPSRRAMVRVRTRVRELTPIGRCHQDLRRVIADVNPVLRGWGAYFRYGQCGDQVCPDRPLRGGAVTRPAVQAVRVVAPPRPCPGMATPLLRGSRSLSAGRDDSLSGARITLWHERSPGSRVREIRTHGLNGGGG